MTHRPTLGDPLPEAQEGLPHLSEFSHPAGVIWKYRRGLPASCVFFSRLDRRSPFSSRRRSAMNTADWAGDRWVRSSIRERQTRSRQHPSVEGWREGPGLQVSKGISGHGNLTAQRVYYSCYVLGCPNTGKVSLGTRTILREERQARRWDPGLAQQWHAGGHLTRWAREGEERPVLFNECPYPYAVRDGADTRAKHRTPRQVNEGNLQGEPLHHREAGQVIGSVGHQSKKRTK